MTKKKKNNIPPAKHATAGDWHTHFTPFFDDMIDSLAYITLSSKAKEVYMIIRKQYRGESYSPGSIVKCPYSTLREQYKIRNESIANAINELEIFGFIEVQRGGLEHRPSEYKLIDKWKTLNITENLDDAKQELAELKRRKKLVKEKRKLLKEESI